MPKILTAAFSLIKVFASPINSKATQKKIISQIDIDYYLIILSSKTYAKHTFLKTNWLSISQID